MPNSPTPRLLPRGPARPLPGPGAGAPGGWELRDARPASPVASRAARRRREERATALLWRLAPLLLPRGLWLSCKAAVLVGGGLWRPDLMVASGLPRDGILRCPPLVVVEVPLRDEAAAADFWRAAGTSSVWEVRDGRVHVHRGLGVRAVGRHSEVRVPRSTVVVPVSALLEPSGA